MSEYRISIFLYEDRTFNMAKHDSYAGKKSQKKTYFDIFLAVFYPTGTKFKLVTRSNLWMDIAAKFRNYLKYFGELIFQ